MNRSNSNPKLALFLGTGFSAAVGGETTDGVSEKFLCAPEHAILKRKRCEVTDKIISDNLREFWKNVFGYTSCSPRPSFEDHFTLIDLAANSGHHLGKNYSPRKLRAIRRFSLHRVFDILNKDIEVEKLEIAVTLFRKLAAEYKLVIITPNWDRLIEDAFKKLPLELGIITGDQSGDQADNDRPILLKLHGSTTWLYCDNCRKIWTDSELKPGTKATLEETVFLEEEDFNVLKGKRENNGSPAIPDSNGMRTCKNCEARLGSRPVTFSYRKDFSISQFQTLWARARYELTTADEWLIIGYSLPEADFEIRSLLKSAQLACRHALTDNFRVPVILRNDPCNKHRYELEATRYFSFFGKEHVQVYGEGLCSNSVAQLVSDGFIKSCKENRQS